MKKYILTLVLLALVVPGLSFASGDSDVDASECYNPGCAPVWVLTTVGRVLATTVGEVAGILNSVFTANNHNNHYELASASFGAGNGISVLNENAGGSGFGRGPGRAISVVPCNDEPTFGAGQGLCVVLENEDSDVL